MTWDEQVALEALDSLEAMEPVTADELVLELQERLAEAELMPAEKVDRVFVTRDLLARWEGAEPPLVTSDIPPEQVDQYGRPLAEAAHVFSLTDHGEAELARLRRLAGA